MDARELNFERRANLAIAFGVDIDDVVSAVVITAVY